MAAASKLSPRDAKRARELAEWVEGLENVGFSYEWAKGEARHLLLALAPRRRVSHAPRSPGETREQRKATKRSVERANRAAVMARADGHCERETGEPGRPLGPCGMVAVERDHFWGRSRDESVEGSWGLCRLCHRAKTENRPSRAYWVWSFARHAMRHGYDAQVTKAMMAIQFEEAQHPEASASRAREG
jgi:hypothetical protein